MKLKVLNLSIVVSGKWMNILLANIASIAILCFRKNVIILDVSIVMLTFGSIKSQKLKRAILFINGTRKITFPF